MLDTWHLRLARVKRPWWGLGIVRRHLELNLLRDDGTEAEVRAMVDQVLAENPKWHAELTYEVLQAERILSIPPVDFATPHAEPAGGLRA